MTRSESMVRARAFVRRRWPLFSAAAAALAVVLWLALARAGEDRDIPDVPGAAAASDSVVVLDTAAQRLAGVELMTVAAGGASTLIANGVIAFDANHVSIVAPRAEGRIATVRADLGQRVPAGAVLATIQSAEVGATRGDLERARVNVEIARRNYERERRLYEQQITPEKEMLDAEGAYRAAQADLQSARSKLCAVGATSGDGATFGLTTPIAGTVVERNASAGQVVGPESNLFTVADLRHVWITVNVYEGDLARIRQGARATVVASAVPTDSLAGRVTFAGGIVDSATRTVKVRVVLDNAGQRLRPGMFAEVHIATPDLAGAGAIVLPEAAVQEFGGRHVVFVADSPPGRFVARTVTLGPRAGAGRLVVTGGLAAGERIAVNGAFQLKAELTKVSFAGED